MLVATHLPALLAAVEAGANVGFARGDTEVARLVPVHPRGERELGSTYRRPSSTTCPMRS
jgi:antitoxin (DNA-binding transcriptional repressor) of toxin-antitoxin stability system